MKQIYFFMICLMASLTINAQNDINFDAASTMGTGGGGGWIGFMNVFETPANGGGFVFGSGWGVPDLVFDLDTGANTGTLRPNRIGDPDPFWTNAGIAEGNKTMDANGYIEDDNLAGTDFTFNFEVIASTLGPAYTYEAFIKVFAADYSSVVTVDSNPLTTTGNVTLTHAASDSAAGNHIQYGFTVIGVNINADPAFDTAYANKGTIIIGPNTTLSVDELEVSEFNVFPNPTSNNWNVKSNQEINSIQVYDVLGKQVLSLTPNTQNVTINAAGLNTGLYFARLTSDAGTKTVKLVRK